MRSQPWNVVLMVGQIAAQCVLTFRMRSHPRNVVLMVGQLAAQCVLTFRMRSQPRNVVLMEDRRTDCSTVCTDL